MTTVNALVPFAFQTSLAFNIFGFGLRARVEDVVYVLCRPRLLVLSLVAMFILTPAIALALDIGFVFRPSAEIALVTLALSPIATLVPKKIEVIGRASYAIGLTVTATFASILLTPALTILIGHLLRREFTVAPTEVARVVLGGVAFPLIAGILTQIALPVHLTRRARAPMRWLATALFVAAIALLIIGASPALRQVADAGTVAAVLAFVVIGLVIGHVMGGPDSDNSTVLALSCVNRHPGVAISVSALSFTTLEFGATVLLYLIANAVVGIPYIAWQRRRKGLQLLRADGEAKLRSVTPNVRRPTTRRPSSPARARRARKGIDSGKAGD